MQSQPVIKTGVWLATFIITIILMALTISIVIRVMVMIKHASHTPVALTSWPSQFVIIVTVITVAVTMTVYVVVGVTVAITTAAVAVVDVVVVVVIVTVVLDSLCEWCTDLQGCLLLEREHGHLHQGISLAAICKILQL